jgi:ATP-dependent exoDNAse (exonuclease V) alpha subunit
MTDEIIFTKGQEIAIDKLHKFLDSDQKVFVLTGAGGTGKTFVIKHALARQIRDDEKRNISDYNRNIIGITLSHKAKNVLIRASIPYSVTFASAYGFKEVINEDGSRDFKPAKHPETVPVGHLQIPIFVHDEVSQYSQYMLNTVLEKTSMFSKIIMMGDPAQLPPIDKNMEIDADSPVFTMDIPDSCKHELTELVRQDKMNPTVELLQILREEIKGAYNLNRVIGEILQPKIRDDKGYECIDQNKIFDEYIRLGSFIDTKIIAFRNFRITALNKEVRNRLFNYTPNSLVPGDLIFMTNTFVEENKRFTLKNSDEFFIESVDRVVIDSEHANNVIECYVGRVKTESNNDAYVIAPTENGIEDYNNTVNMLVNFAKQNSFLWRNKYEFTDSFSEFTMGYAINAYRCQGSTYKNVFVDLLDILNTGPLTPKRKLQTIYTATSRATHKTYFIKP